MGAGGGGGGIKLHIVRMKSEVINFTIPRALDNITHIQRGEIGNIIE